MRVFIINTNIKGSDTKWVYAVHSTLEGAKSHLEDLKNGARQKTHSSSSLRT